MKGLHEHYCGHTDAQEVREGAPKAAEGCGHRWMHDDYGVVKTLLTKGRTEACRLNTEVHMCPKCGKGPWFLVFDGVRETENGPAQATQ